MKQLDPVLEAPFVKRVTEVAVGILDGQGNKDNICELMKLEACDIRVGSACRYTRLCTGTCIYIYKLIPTSTGSVASF